MSTWHLGSAVLLEPTWIGDASAKLNFKFYIMLSDVFLAFHVFGFKLFIMWKKYQCMHLN